MTDIHTSETLLLALRNAAARGVTASEMEKQRVSFIMGSLKDDSGVTRAQVRDVLAKQEGRTATK